MKDCTECKYADWIKSRTGKLHPSGNGWCIYPWKLPKLPASMWWINDNPPIPSSGYISRKNKLEADCVYYQRKV